MSSKLLILAIVLGLAMSLGLVFACGDDDDDNDTLADDDVDDDAAGLTCTEAFNWLYDNCFVLVDEQDNPYDLADVITWCENQSSDFITGAYNCINETYDSCDDFEECYNNL